MKAQNLGDQELALLKHVSEGGPLAVSDLCASYGEPNGLARSTIETVLERLRKKGFLTRSRTRGVFRYRSISKPDELMGNLVEGFVEKTLGGSLVPFVTYFSKQERLSADEKAELKRLLSKLELSDEE